MNIAEKVGQVNQHLYGWECYEKNGDKIELTDEEVAETLGMETPYAYRNKALRIPIELLSQSSSVGLRWVL